MNRPSVFDYLDYRAFLHDMFCHRKLKDRFFSYRYFAGKAGFASPNFLQLVITGRRNLTHASLRKVAKGFELKKQETDFFESLVQMNQAETHEERNWYYQKMISAKGFSNARLLEKASYDYFSKWYYPVIREIAVMGDGTHTPERIAAALTPAIKPAEAKRAMETLQTLGLIRKNGSGRWEQTDAALTTGPEVKSLVVANFHRQMIRLGEESIERHPADGRDVSALTLSINRNQMAEIKRQLAEFRRQLLETACKESDPDQVIQINIQAFPLTTPI